ncbi:MAG: hypothetical protein QW506_03655 [Thermoproteota archaeon]
MSEGHLRVSVTLLALLLLFQVQIEYMACAQATQVIVKTRSPVEITVDKNAGKDDIKRSLKDALVRAAERETDNELKEIMKSAAENDELLDRFAEVLQSGFRASMDACTLNILEVFY